MLDGFNKAGHIVGQSIVEEQAYEEPVTLTTYLDESGACCVDVTLHERENRPTETVRFKPGMEVTFEQDNGEFLVGKVLETEAHTGQTTDQYIEAFKHTAEDPNRMLRVEITHEIAYGNKLALLQTRIAQMDP